MATLGRRGGPSSPRAFNHMAAELAELDRERRDLVANVSHELRTPISSLRAHAREPRRRRRRRPTRPSCARCSRQVERLRRLVSQLLDLARLESGALPAPPGRFAVAGGARRCGRGGARCRDPASAVRVSVAPTDLALDADRERLHQVVANLVENAVRYSPAGAPVDVEATEPRRRRRGAGRVTDRRSRHPRRGAGTGCSSGSTAPTTPGPVTTAAPASASPSSGGSSTCTAGRSRPTPVPTAPMAAAWWSGSPAGPPRAARRPCARAGARRPVTAPTESAGSAAPSLPIPGLSDRLSPRSVVVALLVAGGLADLALRSGIVGVGGSLFVAALAGGVVIVGRLHGAAAVTLAGWAVVFGAWLSVRTSVWVLPLDVAAAAGLLASRSPPTTSADARCSRSPTSSGASCAPSPTPSWPRSSWPRRRWGRCGRGRSRSPHRPADPGRRIRVRFAAPAPSSCPAASSSPCRCWS